MDRVYPVTHTYSDSRSDVMQELVARADLQGYVTYDDLVEVIAEDLDEETVEIFLLELQELGIEVRHRADEELYAELKAMGVEDEIAKGEEELADINAVSADDPVGLYFRQMAQEPLLTAEEEIDLAKRIENGRMARQTLESGTDGLDAPQRADMISSIENSQEAREHLGRANTRLVVSIAKRYMGQGLPFPDLIQEGNVGLMRAVDKYDYTRGNRFSTYATWWIRQAITRALAQKTRTIRIPLHMTERIRQMYRTAQILEQELGRRPTPEEIAEEMDIPAENVRGMMDASQHAIALERPVGDDGDSEFGDFIEDQDTPEPGEAAAHHLLQETIEEVLSELTPRQAHILRLRFGLGGGEQHTLEEIANKFGLSRERIRQLEKEALRRLRHPRLAHNLRDYLS
ncbi:MAG: sigma-70 family RNA polymerase sigma factor [Anaerolineae bacterium]|nr:sigma-70 family RNA polymerase sigma factor [Anaerolineae bacterium]